MRLHVAAPDDAKVAMAGTALAGAQNDVRGRPSQYKQATRKGKQAWRKNIDLSETEAALEDIREQERVVGKPVHERKDSDLFVEDRAGQETALARQARPKRKLKSLEVLQQRSAVPPVQSRARSSFQLNTESPSGKADAAGIPPKLKKRLRILASRPHQGVEGESEMGSAGKIQSDAALATKRDLWGEPSDAAKGPRNEWVPEVHRTPLHKPRSMQHEPHAPAKQMPAVPRPHPGSSYNPDYDQHETLLQQAYQTAEREENDEQTRRHVKTQLHNVQHFDDAGQYMGMRIDDGSDAVPAEREDDEEDVSRETEPQRKTAAQRRREQRAVQAREEAEARKRQRMERAFFSELPKERKAAMREAQRRLALKEERRRLKEERLAREGIAGARVGKHQIPEKRMDVQTGDELSESLRQLRPEGNLFWDRFQNLQARGLAEPRRPVLPTKRKYKLREYDRHYHKRD